MQTPALARQWLVAEADNWLTALRTAAHEHRSDAVLSLTEALHLQGFSESWSSWGHWTELYTLASNVASSATRRPPRPS